jgi:hypothetical protein
MSKRKVGIAIALLLLLCGTIWAVRSSRANAQLQKVRDLGKEARSDPEKRDQFRDAMKKLTPAQREQVFGDWQQERERHMDAEIAKHFALPPDQQLADLDKKIKEDEKRAKEHEARRAQNGGQPNQTGPGPGPGGNGNAGPPGGRQNQTPEQKMQRRNQRLDHSTPQQRAQRTAYRAAMQQRRVQLGLPANPPRPRRPA